MNRIERVGLGLMLAMVSSIFFRDIDTDTSVSIQIIGLLTWGAGTTIGVVIMARALFKE